MTTSAGRSGALAARTERWGLRKGAAARGLGGRGGLGGAWDKEKQLAAPLAPRQFSRAYTAPAPRARRAPR